MNMNTATIFFQRRHGIVSNDNHRGGFIIHYYDEDYCCCYYYSYESTLNRYFGACATVPVACCHSRGCVTGGYDESTVVVLSFDFVPNFGTARHKITPITYGRNKFRRKKRRIVCWNVDEMDG